MGGKWVGFSPLSQASVHSALLAKVFWQGAGLQWEQDNRTGVIGMGLSDFVLPQAAHWETVSRSLLSI